MVNQTELRRRFNPDGSLLREHQLRMLEMLKYIDSVCKKHNISYWLSSGTLLGAVRHGGFIPWDDDLDIEMPRKDYLKLIKVLKKEINPNYALQTHKTDIHYLYPFAKLRDLHSVIKETHDADIFYKYKGVYVDLFPLEPLSKGLASKFVRKHQKLKDRVALEKDPKKRERLIVRGWFCLSVRYFWIRLWSRMSIRNEVRHTWGSWYSIFRVKTELFPLSQVEFEGCRFPAPRNVDKYLTRLYGNYLQLPDIEKIEIHTVNVKLN